jgi:hypothetical protein
MWSYVLETFTAEGKCEAGKAELSIADDSTLGFTSTPLFIHG